MGAPLHIDRIGISLPNFDFVEIEFSLGND